MAVSQRAHANVDLDGGSRPQEGSGAMFDRIAARYDLINRLLSFGIDRRWRRHAAAAIGSGKSTRVLDMACGTGEMSVEILRQHEGARVLGLDPSAGMLRIASQKLTGRDFDCILGDGQHLPLPSASVDAAIVAFGVRNVPNRARALAEMRRVVVSGGRVVVLELSEPRGWRGALFRFYFRRCAPAIGAILSRAPAYRYLVQSVSAFPTAEVFAQTMEDSGLCRVRVKRLTLGAAHLYIGWVKS